MHLDKITFSYNRPLYEFLFLLKKMLQEVRLQNYTIIDDLSLSFDRGFSVITGETGAGKSIFVEALALLLGGRSDSDAVRHEHEEAVLEARFDPLLPQNEELILKRVLSRSKGRAYINGSFVNLVLLQQAGAGRAEIHGQHSQQRLIQPAYQLALLDAYAKNGDFKQQYRTHYKKRLDLIKEIALLKKELPDSQPEEESLRYQLTEITEAHLQPNEEDQLLIEERQLKNWEGILTAVQGGHTALSEEGGVLSQMRALEQFMKDLHHIAQDAAPELDLMNSACIPLKELASLLRNRKEIAVYDPYRQSQVAQRLYLIQKLKKRYGGSVEAILDRAGKMTIELQSLSERKGRLAQLEEALAAHTALLLQAAQALSSTRAAAIHPLEKKVKEEIHRLGMEKTEFTVMHHEKPFSEEGKDAIEFLIALPGEPSKPIARIASGGELSRLILAIKVALAEVDPIPTLIFDEIDAGISGGVAEQVGRCLFRLSRKHQVFCVTHLPQVARFADHHYVAEKKFVHHRAVLSIRKLTQEERVMELARLLGGMTITRTTRRHAEELVQAVGNKK